MEQSSEQEFQIGNVGKILQTWLLQRKHVRQPLSFYKCAYLLNQLL